MKYKLVAGVIAKDEEWIIDKTVSALTRFCDLVVVYDDGSTDKTEAICRSYDKVVWKVRPSHDPLVREEAKQRLELIDLVGEHDPDYVLLLDADEIPTPSIVPFLDTVESPVRRNTNLFRTRMINLWEDESKYRVDSYITRFGTSVQWDPFTPNAWVKFPLLKYDRNERYAYNLHVQKGGCSRYHPAPQNVPDPVENQEDFYIMHYGKLASDFINGERFKFYARIEALDGRGSYEQRLGWHMEHNRHHTCETRPTKKEWFWK